jgi:hypothetical protein
LDGPRRDSCTSLEFPWGVMIFDYHLRTLSIKFADFHLAGMIAQEL